MKIKKIPWLVIGLIGSISVLFFIFWLVIAFNGQTQKLQSESRKNDSLAADYKRKTSQLSPNQILDVLKKENVNVTSSLNDVTSRINKAIDLTYNKTKDEKDYKKLSKTLPKLIGKSFSYNLIQLDKPIINQSGKKSFPFGPTTDVVVTFGKYNYHTIEIPVYVAVNYQTSTVGSKSKIEGQDLYTLQYELKSRDLGFIDHERGNANAQK